MPGDPSPNNKQRKVIDENFPLIRNRPRKIIRGLKSNNLDEQFTSVRVYTLN